MSASRLKHQIWGAQLRRCHASQRCNAHGLALIEGIRQQLAHEALRLEPAFGELLEAHEHLHLVTDPKRELHKQ
eukprot:1570036-Prymnesium_polylepis.1